MDAADRPLHTLTSGQIASERSSTWLLEHASDTHSQTGEGGIISKALELLPELDSWCVEFGAWDGQFLSNTRKLIENHSYAAVLIEADAKKFDDLQRFHAERANVTTLNQFVGFDPDDNLDTLLASTAIPVDFDVLSIDVDGNDYHIWERARTYKPKLVCVEFNPTIATGVNFVQNADHSINHGASLSSLYELGTRKGYELISVLPYNAVFVKREYFPLFGIDDNRPETLRTDTSHVTHIFSGYDGLVMLAGSQRLPWHEFEISSSRVQQIPKIFRTHPGHWGRLRALAFGLSASLSRRLRRA